MITVKATGSFNNIERALRRMSKFDIAPILNRYGLEGVNALSSATPQDTGETAGSWYFDIDVARGGSRITWHNTHIVDGVPIAIILQYGHGTGTGGFVQGRDYINPAIQPLFDQIANEVWKAVTS